MATNKNFIVKNGLEVGGDIIVTGSLQTSVLTLPASDGTSGQVIVTDGSGNLSFQTIVSNFTISDGTNTDTFNTGETLTFTAGTGITTTVSNNVVTIEGVAQYDDADAVAAIESHPHLTIDGGTLYVDTANDYVGIGDTSPQHKLDVAGAIGVNGTEVIDSTGEVITAQLKDSGVTAGSYGSASLVPVITVDAKGRITSASTTSVAGVSSFSYDTPTEVLTINTADGGSFNADISSLASQSYVDTAVAGLVDSAPGTLDTLNELAAALGDDPNFATTIATAINGKVDSTGDAFTGNVTFGDNNKAIFGAGSDLQIYHDGSYSYIDEVGTNDLVIRGSNNIWIQRADGTETLAKFTTDGACEFRYDNAPRLATTSTGVDVTGTITSDGLTLDGGVYKINNTSVGSGSDKWIGSDGGAGVFVNAGASGNFSVYNNNSLGRFNINGSTGDIMFLEDTGTAAKFFWDASAESLGIGTTSPAAKINTSGAVGAINSIQTQVLLSETGTNTGTGLQIKANNSTYSWDAGAITFLREGAANSYALTFDTSSGGTDSEAMRIDSSGRVGIATNGAVTDIPGTSHDTVVVGNNGMSAAGVILNVANGSNSTFGFYDNTGTTPAARMLWDSSADKLHFYTRNSSANGEAVHMTIQDDGKVGIGTASPQRKLHSVDNGAQLRINRTDGADDTWEFYSWSDGLNIYPVDAASTVWFGRDGQNTDVSLYNGRLAVNHTGAPPSGYAIYANGSIWAKAGAGDSGGLRLHSNSGINVSGNAMSFHTGQINGFSFNGNSDGADNNNQLVVIKADGKVGIGTASPDFTVDVTHQATGQTDVMRLKGHTGNAFVRFQDNDNSSDWTFGSDDNSGLGSGALIAYDRNNTAYRWGLDSAGRLYLGTTTSSPHKVNIRSDQATGILINAVNAYSGSGTSTMLNLTNNTDTDIQLVINEVGAATKYASIGSSVTGRALVLGAPSGNVGIGTNSPSQKFHVIGNILASGNITAYSDISLKDNITSIPNALDKVLQIRGVTYNRNDIEDNPRHTGVIAQEVEKVLPEVISESEDGIKSVAYGNMVGLLVEAIKELKAEIEELKGR